MLLWLVVCLRAVTEDVDVPPACFVVVVVVVVKSHRQGSARALSFFLGFGVASTMHGTPGMKTPAIVGGLFISIKRKTAKKPKPTQT